MSTGADYAPEPGKPSPQPEQWMIDAVDESCESYQQLEVTRRALFAGFSDYFQDPKAPNDTFERPADDYRQAFLHAVQEPPTGTTSQHLLFLQHLTIEESEKRCKFLNGLCGQDIFRPLMFDNSQESMDKILATDDEDPEEQHDWVVGTTNSIIKQHNEKLINDCDFFLEALKQAGRGQPSQRERMVRLVGETARNVGTTAAGVVIGGIILRRIFR